MPLSLGNRGLGDLVTLRPTPRPRDPLACEGAKRERERSGMVDLRAETASSSDTTEFTETEDQSRTLHLYVC